MLYHLNEYHDRHVQRLSNKKLKESVLCVIEEEEEKTERNINNIPCDTQFQSPVAMNVQKKYAKFSTDKQVGKIIDSEEHVDARSQLRNNSAEWVDAKSDSEKLVVDGSDQEINPRITTHTTNGISVTHITNGISTQNY